MSNDKYINICESTEEVGTRVAQRWLAIAQQSIEHHGRFDVAVGVGEDTCRVFKALAKAANKNEFPWDKTHLFFCDELQNSDGANHHYQQVNDLLLQHVPLPAAQVYPIVLAGESIDHVAQSYANTLSEKLMSTGDGGVHFDLTLLEVGVCGGVGSIFHESEIAKEWEALLMPVPQGQHTRLSITLPVIEASRFILLVATGAEKASIMNKVLTEPAGNDAVPAQNIQHIGMKEWFLDSVAGAELPSRQ